MTGNRVPQRRGRSLIKENAHSRHRQRTAGGMVQHCPGLLHGDARKPIDELVHGSVVFKVFKQRCHRHPRAEKHPRTADNSGVSFDGCTSRPVNHGGMVALAHAKEEIVPQRRSPNLASLAMVYVSALALLLCLVVSTVTPFSLGESKASTSRRPSKRE